MNRPTWYSSIHHDGSPTFITNPAPQIGDKIGIFFRTGKETPLNKIYLRMEPDGEQAFYEMKLFEETSTSKWYQIEIQVTESLFHYRFLLDSEDGLFWYNAKGIFEISPLDNQDFKIRTGFQSVSWLNKAVFYQIFPDSFANGNSSIDVEKGEISMFGIESQTIPWDQLPPEGRNRYLTFYGGDLAGIEQRIDYLEKLGINAIYLNPIFTAPTPHKYDVTDYLTVDPHFGGNSALDSLKKKLDNAAIHLILDIVPNHCGHLHEWFQKALQDEDAPEAQFFSFHEHPEKYTYWLFAKSLPKLNYRSEKLRDLMYRKPDAIMQKWLNLVDGWRVDVGNMLAREGDYQARDEIVSEMRIAIKGKGQDKLFLGENFFDATSQLQGNQFDSTMNYKGFMFPILYWLSAYEMGDSVNQVHIKSKKSISTQAMVEALESFRAHIPWALFTQQFNLLGSHDTPRVRTLVNENDALHRLAILFQFTYPGVPCIYYGDEIGMINLPNIGERGTMIWDESKQNQQLFSFYQALIELRKTSEALVEGSYQIMVQDENQFIFMRATKTEKIIISLNRSEKNTKQILLSMDDFDIIKHSVFRELFDGEEIIAKENNITIPSHSQGAKLWRWDGKKVKS